ncbi:ketopantoate reductase family protein [Novosphingobium soli]|uniref:2-dehydropantoate 2-reductase n=1 Tax=Novosphingobium soli TaxID=574956 RepID=A0ABV6CZB9_9SPHN
MSANPRLCVFGAGAVGTLVAARLADAGGQVTVIARGARLRQLGERGLQLRSASGAAARLPVAARAAAEAGPQDVVFVALKGGDIPAALPELLQVVGPQTRLVPLVNGIPWWYRQPLSSRPVAAVDPQGALAAAFDPRRIVGAVLFLTSAMDAEGVATVQGAERIVLGPVVPGAENDAGDDAAQVGALFAGSGIDAAVVPDIRADLWAKVALNLATNPLSVVADATLEQQFRSDALLPVVSAVLDETVAVARAHGVEPRLTRERMLEIGARAGPFYTSMAQDHRRGVPLELGAICLSVFELAAEAGVAMPVARAVYDLCRFRAAAGGAAA